MELFYKNFKKHIFTNIEELPKNTIIIIYGSAAYGKFYSDLDVVFIIQDYNEYLYKTIEKTVIKFQKDNNMKIDVEVPYSNKLVYTFSEVNSTLDYTLFKKSNGKYEITPIIITREYFSSIEMKKRLLLNILTTYSKTINGEEEVIQKYKNLAWKNVIKMISSYNSLRVINIDEFIDSLYYDKKNNKFGEDYLGYKESNPMLKKHIEICLINTLKEFEKEKFVIKKDSRNYIICGR